MNLLKLKNDIDFTINHLREYNKLEDIPVLITLYENSVGARASTNVSYVGMGMDWESGQFRIEPSIKLVKINNSLQDIKPVKQKNYEGRNYYFCPRCESKISKDDKYCRYCSQKLK